MNTLPDDFYDELTAPTVSRLASQLTARSYIPLNEFCEEVSDFFDVYDKGSFYAEAQKKSMNKLFVNPVGLSYIVKRLVNLLPTPDHLILSLYRSEDNLYLKFMLDTSDIGNLLFHELCEIASKSGFGFIMKSDYVILSAEIMESEILNVYAGKARYVYAALKDMLMNPTLKRPTAN